MNPCEQLKESLVTDGQQAIEQSEPLTAHLQNCADCQQLIQAWLQVPQLLEQLPEYGPDDELLHTVSEAATARAGKNSQRRRFLAPSLASAVVVLAVIGLSREMILHESPKTPYVLEKQRDVGQTVRKPDVDSSSGRRNDTYLKPERQKLASDFEIAGQDRLEETLNYRSDDARLADSPQDVQQITELDQLKQSAKRTRDVGGLYESEPQFANVIPAEEFRRGLPGGKSDFNDNDGLAKNSADKKSNQPAIREASEPALNSLLVSGEIATHKAEISQKEIQREQIAGQTESKFALTGRAGGYTVSSAKGKARVGFDFLSHYQQTSNLQFQPATGYWANTYIPGDPQIRLLSARLAQWDRDWLGSSTDLEEAVAPVEQPFDAPADNALSLSLMADASAVFVNNDSSNTSAQLSTRMRLQVGIRGIEHRRGQRPAMNVGVVVDLPADAPDEVRIATRALLDAMLQSKQAGDHFSLVLTGQPGKTRGLVVAADDFRFGSLQLAKQIILAEDTTSAKPDLAASNPSTPDLSRLDLYQAIQYAGTQVQENDDPSRPLGSSSIVLISARPYENINRLSTLAHSGATQGTTLSVFPLGDKVHTEQVEQLVLAGLGNRRYLEAPAQARQMIEAELHAASRAVARAARLSIRLAPGVKLIKVVGSERLDTQRAERVREIENSMDHRLSANLGIQADRGADENGIQIVIPSIFSGDSVTVLLDVITDRPGAIADVSLRYKDLVFLRNGNLQDHLELAGSHSMGTEPDRGPAELAVLKNLLAHHFASAVEQAAAALGHQQTDQAISILRAMHTTIEQARQALPAWANDPDLIRDQQILDRYIDALTSPQAGANRSFLTDSLQYAAWAKTHRPLEEWK